MNTHWLFVVVLLALTPAFAQASPETLAIDEAISLAIASDPWLSGSRHREGALNSESISAATLPDPKVNLVAANFPTDGFDINQEPMTPLVVGVSQMFPRGDSLELSSRLIEQDRSLLEQLVDAKTASYSSALGHARQQDIIGAQ